MIDAPPNSLMDSTMSPKVKTTEGEGVGVLPSSQHWGKRACWSSEIGLGRVTSISIIHTDLHKLNKKLVSAKLKHFWCMDESRINMNSHNSPWFGLGESHHLPPYSILCAWPQNQHPNIILPNIPKWESQNSQNWDSRDFGGA